MQHCKLYSIKVLNCEARSSLLSLSNFAYYITYPQILSPMLCTPWLLNRNQINSRDAPFQVIRYENSGLLNPDSFHYPSSTVPDTAVHKVTSVSHLKWGFVMSELLELFGHYASVCSFFGISVPSVTGDWVTWEECSAPHFHSHANKLAGELQALRIEVLNRGVHQNTLGGFWKISHREDCHSVAWKGD